LNLAPFSFFMGVAGEPPLLALAVSTRAGEPKDTAKNLVETGEFVVNAATEDLAEAVNHASGDWAPDVDEFALTGTRSRTVDACRAAAGAGRGLVRSSAARITVVRWRGAARRAGWWSARWCGCTCARTCSRTARARAWSTRRASSRSRAWARILYSRLGEVFALDRPKV
jgi:hypothetical protein